MRRLVVTLVAVAIAASGLAAGARADGPERAKNQFIVRLRSGANPALVSAELTKRYGGRVQFVYDAVVNGFAFKGSQAAASAIASDPRVAGVDHDYVVHLADTAPPDAADHLEATRSNCTTSNVVAGPPPECKPNATTFPTADQSGYKGAGSIIAILDTGVRASHPYLNDGVHNVIAAYGRCSGGSAKDRNGHGTATASNAAGEIGVAHDASIVNIKVFPGASEATTWSRVICGLNYVRRYNNLHPGATIGVANLSIAGGGSRALRRAVEAVIGSGVVVTAAAGNDNGGRVQAPAKYTGVISGSALNHLGTAFASFSAQHADIAAPGARIFSAALGASPGNSNRSGTSRVAPQLAGAAAILLALGVTPATMLATLVQNGRCPGGTHRGATPCSSNWPGGSNEPLLDAYCAASAAPLGIPDPTNCA